MTEWPSKPPRSPFGIDELKDFQIARAEGLSAEVAARVAVPEADASTKDPMRWAVIASRPIGGSIVELIFITSHEEKAFDHASAWVKAHAGYECYVFRTVASFRSEVTVTRSVLP